MSDIIQFVPKHNLQAAENLAEFINICKEKLTVFGSELDWESNHWSMAGITFGNMDHKTRKLDPINVMQQPFLDFAKAYFRYQQGHNPTKSFPEIRALKCIERAFLQTSGVAAINNLS